MTLGEYLRSRRLSYDAFGQRFGVSHTTVGRWVNGTSEPDPALIPRIVAATGGVVSPVSLAPKAAAAARFFTAAMARHALAIGRAKGNANQSNRI